MDALIRNHGSLRVSPSQGGPCAVCVHAPAADASWKLRIPEGLSCEQGIFKTHDLPQMDWHGPDNDGAIWSAWETNPDDFARITQSPATRQFTHKLIQGIRYRVTIGPMDDGLILRFTATNTTTDRPWSNVLANPCLGGSSPQFEDPEMKSTFLMTTAGLLAMKDVDRGTGDPIRTHFDVVGQPLKPLYGEWFWGKPSKTLSSDGTIFKTGKDGRFTIGFGWKQVGGLYQNEDAHHCIHSVVALGELAPGRTRTVSGRIILVQGDARLAHKHLTDSLSKLVVE